MPSTSAEPVVLTIATGVSGGGADQKDYNYVGTFPGVMEQSGSRFPGGNVRKVLTMYNTGVIAPWARRPVKFRV